MQQIMLKCGYDSLMPFGEFWVRYKPNEQRPAKLKLFEELRDRDPGDAIREVTSRFQSCDIKLELVFYGGFSSIWSGGRASPRDVESLIGEITRTNRLGIFYSLALNGGLLAEEVDEPGNEENLALDELSRNNQIYNVRNKVVVLRDKIYRLVNDRFPNLELISSCIQQLEPNNPDDYRQRFAKYDYVVILNQHSTVAFLSQFQDFAHQMIVFLNHHCARTDLHRCYEHMILQEIIHRRRNPNITDLFLHPPPDRIPESEYVTDVPSQLIVKPGCDGGELFKRQEDLTGLLAMGVTKFKIPRNEYLTPDQLEIFLGCIATNRSSQDVKPKLASSKSP